MRDTRETDLREEEYEMPQQTVSVIDPASHRGCLARVTAGTLPFYVFLVALSFSPYFASTAGARTTVGHVVSVEGEAYAQAPGETARRLECDSPIYRHDFITTTDNTGLAIMSGDAYVRLAGNSTLRFGTRSAGSPALDLELGQVRMIDMGNGSRTGSISTPGLLLADARSNSEAIVFAEKIWTVSMICSQDDAVVVARRDNPRERTVSYPGECTIGKPKEPLYTAAASHDTLALLARAQCDAPDVQLGLADRFAPGDLAGLLPAVGAGPPRLAPPAVAVVAPALAACTAGASCAAALRFIPVPLPAGLPPPPP
jgi:hypothetical protein